MNKYINAIREYEFSRLVIKDLTNHISLSIGENDYETGDYERKCKNGFEHTCLDMLYNYNRVEKTIATCKKYGDEYPELPYEERPILCECCKLTDHYVQLRKQAKKRFGVAKRTISALGKGIIKSSGDIYF